jgi:hypothetical protein
VARTTSTTSVGLNFDDGDAITKEEDDEGQLDVDGKELKRDDDETRDGKCLTIVHLIAFV